MLKYSSSSSLDVIGKAAHHGRNIGANKILAGGGRGEVVMDDSAGRGGTGCEMVRSKAEEGHVCDQDI